ncbi:MAG: hypothetical protein NWR91_07080, partial [Schleiferiaceae bacterium]|nr:hypothetical protein [Schleiferiaceae bacterium]
MNIRALAGGLITSMVLGFSAEAQTISLLQPFGLTACTGDSLLLELQIAGSDMQPTNSFKVLYAPGTSSAFTLALSDTAQIVKWRSILPLPVSTDSNSVGTKYAWVVVPESITTGGTFSIVVKSSLPSLWSDTIQLVVSVSPTSTVNSITGGFNNLHTNIKDWGFCEGDTVSLTANPGQVGYQWYKDAIALPGATSVILDVFNSGTYSVKTFTAFTGGCTKMSRDTVVNMFTPSTAVVHLPGSMTTIRVLDSNATIDSVGFCETETIQLQGPSTTAAGTSVLYQWLRDSTDAFGQAITVPVLGSTQRTFSTFTGGVYYLETTWLPGGCPDTSEAFWLFVDSVPDTEIQALAWPGQPQANLTICADDSTQLAAITFSNDWTYQWEVRFPAGSGNWTAIPGETGSKLNVSTAIVADDAEYRLVIDNDYCRHTTSELLVTVVDLPLVNVAPTDSLALCAGDSVLVGATGNSTSYLWTFPGGSYSGASFYANTPGTYAVAGTNSNGCTSYDSLKIYFYSVNANAGPDQTILPGTTFQLAASGGSLYYW